jgi:RNA polymerase sigma factor (sigma-70 family)
MAYMVRSLRDFHAAEDAFQETFLRAFRAYPRLPESANRRAWLYKIALNVCNDERRRRGRQPQSTQAETTAAGDPEGGDRNLVIAVRTFVDGLPPRQRHAVLLRKFQGLDYDEISTVLGCSTEAARANVYQGLRRIRAHFAEVTYD